MKTVAWSEERETRTRGILLFCTFAMLIGIVVIMVGVYQKSASVAIGGTILFSLSIASLIRWNTYLERMLPNKPFHGAQGLTRWHWHTKDTVSVTCPCGLINTFEGKEWCPNELDHGGGRFSFVCKCGRGHYKFRSDIT